MVNLDISQELGLSVIRDYSDMSVSNICGFILYGREHPNVKKVLKDKDYWDAFDAISGPNWPIFAPEPLDPKVLVSKSKSSKNGSSFMLAAHVDTDKTKAILDLFGLTDSEELPCFVLFAWNEKGDLLSDAYRIPDSTVDEVYNSLREVISEVAKAERLILPNYKRTNSVYRETLKQVKHLRFMHKWRTIKGGFKTVFEFIAGLASISSAAAL